MSDDPVQWPRQHFTPVRGVRVAKRGFASEEEARRFDGRGNMIIYQCSYCEMWHRGTERKDAAC